MRFRHAVPLREKPGLFGTIPSRGKGSQFAANQPHPTDPRVKTGGWPSLPAKKIGEKNLPYLLNVEKQPQNRLAPNSPL